MDFDEIRGFHRLEKNTSRLSELPIDFLPELKKLLETEKSSYQTALSEGNLQQAANYSNLKKLVSEIFQLRQKKIFNKASISVKNNEFEEEGLLEEEKPAYKGMCSLIGDYNKLPDLLLDTQRQAQKDKPLNTISVKILKEVPAFIGPDMKEYGPFEKGQATDISGRTEELLVARGMAEKK